MGLSKIWYLATDMSAVF